MKPTTMRIDENIMPELKNIAKRLDRSVTWVVNDALKKLIESEKEKGTIKLTK